jgi:hypothetical protein
MAERRVPAHVQLRSGGPHLAALTSGWSSASFDDHATVVQGRSVAALVPTTSHDLAANNNDMIEWSPAIASKLSGLPVFHSRRACRLVSSDAVPSGASFLYISMHSPFCDHN